MKLHANPNYGVASLAFAPIVAEVISLTEAKSISDYGAGKQRLREGLVNEGVKVEQYFPYDPAFPAYGPPQTADLVCCIDVLEHIEPELLGNVLTDLARITLKHGFFSIHLGPAAKVLDDGRNAHLIQKPISWWLERLIQHFEVIHLQRHKMMGEGCWMVVSPRVQSK